MNQDFQKLYDDARQAGLDAANKMVPRPMIVGHPSTPLGTDVDPNQQTWYVPDGVCGFAWIVVRPGTCRFARWLTKNNLGRRGYSGGIHIWVSDFGQSMQRKEAYAHAFAHVLNAAGIKAYPNSRMD